MQQTPSQDSISRGGFFNLLGSVSSFVLGVGSNILVARLLGPELKGVFVLFLTTQAILLVPGNAIQTSLVHLIANRRPSWPGLRRFSYWISILQAVVTVALLLALFQSASVKDLLFGPLSTAYLGALFVCLLGSLICLYRSALLPGAQRYSRYALWGMIANLIQVAIFLGTLTIWWLWPGNSELLIWVLVGHTLSVVAMAGLWIYATWRPDYISSTLFKGSVMLPAVGAFALPVMMRNLVEWMNLKVDVYFVNGFVGARELGVYTVAVGLAQQLWIVPFALAGPLFARVSQEGDNPGSRQMTRYAFRVTALITVVMSIGIGAGAPFVLPFLYGDQYRDSIWLLVILLPGIMCMGPTRALSSYLNGIGKPREPLRAELVGLVVTLCLDIALIPKFGAGGAALATAVSYVLYSFFLCHRFMKISESTWSDLLWLKRADWLDLVGRLRVLPSLIQRFRWRKAEVAEPY